MQNFVKIAKIILYCLIGGILAFVVTFMGSYLKASSIAGDIARSGLLLASQEGCINYDQADAFCKNMHLSYGYDTSSGVTHNTKSILVSDHVKELTGTNADTADGVAPKDTAVFYIDENDFNSHYGLIAVSSQSNPDDVSPANSLINNSGEDYNNFVQRGEAITCFATVEANMYFNWVFGNNRHYAETTGKEASGGYELRFTFPVNAQATGISTKWYKGVD